MNTWWTWAITGIIICLVVAFTYLAVNRARRINTAHRQVRIKISGDVTGIDVGAVNREAIEKLLSKMGLLSADEVLSRAIRGAVKTGLLMFNVPTEMLQGQKERVEVGIARSTDLRKELISELRGHGEPHFKEIDTSLYMEVKLDGPAFEITTYSPIEQLLIPTPARWEFDVLPCRAGRWQITLHVNMRIEAEGIVGGRRGVSSLEKQIDVQVNIPYATRRFVAANWQWLIPAVVALAGTVAAWLVVPF